MEKQIIRDLGDGLILRQATPQDTEALADFNARIHSDNGPEEPEEGVRTWVKDLMERPHPTFQPGDFTIVEDTRTQKIVSSLNLISQTWTYEGIDFGVGRPELVATAPEYRNRGLVRAQFEVIHAWSAARGEMVLGITGIPYYYRLFGYEMAMDLGGGRFGFKQHIPRLADGIEEPFRIRQAISTDLGFIADLYQQRSQRYLVDCQRDESLWLNELTGKSIDSVNRRELRIIETPGGEAVGYLAHPVDLWRGRMVATQYELTKAISWSLVTPSVVRYLYAATERLAAQSKKPVEANGYGFWLGQEHPVYTLVHDDLPLEGKPYAWYLRLPDLPGFIRHIAPALEKHLAGSVFRGYTGEIKITFYRDGLWLGIENGRLVKIAPYRPEPVGHSGGAGFPGLTFLQLLFGYRSLEELTYAFADCWYDNEEIYGALTALFPKKPSHVWPIS
jgi:hypothetical protein